MAIPKHLLEAKICNEETCKLANYIPANEDYKKMACKLVVENANLKRKMINAVEHLKLKQIRLINEFDYIIDDLDLDEIMKILDLDGDEE